VRKIYCVIMAVLLCLFTVSCSNKHDSISVLEVDTMYNWNDGGIHNNGKLNLHQNDARKLQINLHQSISKSVILMLNLMIWGLQ